jgi:hypothetical protein
LGFLPWCQCELLVHPRRHGWQTPITVSRWKGWPEIIEALSLQGCMFLLADHRGVRSRHLWWERWQTKVCLWCLVLLKTKNSHLQSNTGREREREEEEEFPFPNKPWLPFLILTSSLQSYQHSQIKAVSKLSI